jgi:1-deoxy-D-xylulose-5-phosphate synthase
MPILETITDPAALKKLPFAQLPELAQEIRERIIHVTSENGGHVAPNLGVVELTIALHRVFDTPDDNFVFDVSHQSYVHKLLTGRNGPEFDKLRQTGGISGFFNRAESEHDAFGAGHAGTALSAALGLATARDLRGGKEHVVALLGDAAFTCGTTLEAINNLAATTRRLVLVLNDNEWAIDKNVGAIADCFNSLITSPLYTRAHQGVEQLLKKLPGGEHVLDLGRRVKRDTKDFIAPHASIFEKLKLRYIGPVDGHNIEHLCHYLEFCKRSDNPVLLHVRTTKGKGLHAAEGDPEKFHGASPYQIETGESKKKPKPGDPPLWQEVFGKTLVQCATRDPRIVGITAAMPTGTSLNLLKQALPKQYFDVGIAEGHAVVFAAGLAAKGFKPVCAIYSTFLQRALDMVFHDVCLQALDVAFFLDRAGLSPADGATHHGLFDIAFLRSIPRAVIMQPKDEDELADMTYTAIEYNGPAFVRYPRGDAPGAPVKEQPALLPIGVAEVVKDGADVQLWALGALVADAQDLARRLETEFPKLKIGVVNARFAKPLDSKLLIEQAKKARLLVTLEDHVLAGGFGSAVLETLSDAALQTPVERIGWPDNFVEHGTTQEILREAYGLSHGAVFERIAKRLRG